MVETSAVVQDFNGVLWITVLHDEKVLFGVGRFVNEKYEHILQ